jgi:predicted acyl esterase
VRLQVRHPGERFVERHETEWPLARTQWTDFHLHPDTMSLSPHPYAGAETQLTYEAMGQGLTFMTAPMTEPTEITGPSAVKLHISSSTEDADVFVVLRVFDPAGKEVVFQGALDPHNPISLGWLRASHRKLDPARSLPYRPYHSHDEKQVLRPGEKVPLDVEIWPTCIVVPAGYRIALSVRGRDYEWDGPAASLSNMKNPMKGCGPFVHDDDQDRPPEIFHNQVSIHFGGEHTNRLLLPVIPTQP